MADTSLKIAVCINENKWHLRFYNYLSSYAPHYGNIHCEFVDINHDDWIEKISNYDLVFWKPNHMGVESASYFKEKVFFIETYLKKIIVPNFNSVWHFESKVAQKYIFDSLNIPTPKTVATFDYNDALAKLQEFKMPVVLKQSTGAGSTNVSLIHSRKKALTIINQIFCRQAAEQIKLKKGRFWGRFSLINLSSWLNRYQNKPNQPVAYWQEFIPGNSRDLRITVIGNRFAFGFWRQNRPNDFRASGSGRIDYSTPIPTSAIRYCINISERLGFDSMAYDLLFENNGLKVVEMSYGYVDTAIYKAPGYYELKGEELDFIEGNYWPQELWVKWGLMKLSEQSDIID